MSLPAPSRDLVERFRRDLLALADMSGNALGVAVSGGPDSLALLLLAAAALPGRVEAATVDHRLRPEGAGEAAFVAQVCARMGVPHTILDAEWRERPSANLQAQASEERYRLLALWAGQRGLTVIATAHHVDDQAETLLMRLARGAGVRGLAGIRPRHAVEGAPLMVVRPLLTWRRAELAQLVTAAGLVAVDDPSNRDARFDRTRFRALLASLPDLDPPRLARSAACLAQADEAIEWSVESHWRRGARLDEASGHLFLDVSGLPVEYRRRLLLRALREVRRRHGLSADWSPRGEELEALLARLQSGAAGERPATLGEILCAASGEGGWRFAPAPPRRGAGRR